MASPNGTDRISNSYQLNISDSVWVGIHATAALGARLSTLRLSEALHAHGGISGAVRWRRAVARHGRSIPGSLVTDVRGSRVPGCLNWNLVPLGDPRL